MILIRTIYFLVFLGLQALFINGVYYCFEKDNIFYKINPGFFDRIKKQKPMWAYPLWLCVRCMSSVYGTATFWITVIPLFGFDLYEVWVWIGDIFILCTLNWLLYKIL